MNWGVLRLYAERLLMNDAFQGDDDKTLVAKSVQSAFGRRMQTIKVSLTPTMTSHSDRRPSLFELNRSTTTSCTFKEGNPVIQATGHDPHQTWQGPVLQLVLPGTVMTCWGAYDLSTLQWKGGGQPAEPSPSLTILRAKI